jgi:HSP20 family protein
MSLGISPAGRKGYGWLAASQRLCDHLGMRSRIHTVVLPSDVGDFADEVHRVFLELGRTLGAEELTGECSPAIDVYETDDAIEVVVDLPGVDRGAVRVIIKGDDLLVAGEKTARKARGESSFHLVERGYGRFARAVRLARPCDSRGARATLVDGELRVRLPKIADRRGRGLQIPIDAPSGSPAH